MEGKLAAGEEFKFFPKVGEIAHLGVISLSSEATVREAVGVMRSRNLGDIIFRHGDGYAIFTVDDLLDFRRRHGRLSATLGELVGTPLECVDRDDNVLSLLHRFDDTTSRYLGVTNSVGELVGVVSYTDVLDSVDPSVMMERKTLADLLTVRSIRMIDGASTTESALQFLNNAEDAVLVSEAGELAGILTTKDAVRIINDDVDLRSPVRQHMTAPVHTISKQETVKGAIAYLKERKFKRAIVVDELDGHVIGIVSQRDLINSTYGRWADLMKLHAHELDELIRVLESKNQRLLQESLTDPLTGVANRRQLGQRLEAEVGRYYRHGALPFALLMLDIDSFKQINDTLGHAFGDRVLRRLCDAVAAQLRVADLLGRWGGEEFVVLLPDTPLAEASEVAGRLCAAVAAAEVDGKRFTVSIGVAEYRKGESIDELLERVDAALYRAKTGGRNRVVSAQE